VARDGARLETVAGELAERYGIRAEVLPADLSRDDDASRVVARLDAAPVDVLVNNAGFGASGGLARAPREPQESMLRVHVLAVHRLTQAAVQSMVPRGSGAIITVSSVASYLTSPGNANYCSTKAYQRLYMETLALEVARRGIYVQALCPGFTHTEFHARAGVDKTRQPKWMWMEAERVVRESLSAMRRRGPVVVIPGLRYRLIVFLLRWLPKWLQNALARSYRRDVVSGRKP
jgi:short-subunit dehydrogenase